MASKYVMVWFGLGGFHADQDCTGTMYANAHLSGYDKPDQFFKIHGHELIDNCPVIDKRAVLEEHPEYSYRAPLCDVKREVSEQPITSISYVNIPDYLAYWRKCGARIGRWDAETEAVAWEG